ncbi:ATPase of ABC-type cobalt transport system [Salmonella enterica subsp. enterica serovar Give str. S5-487]|nr:ATPase of ABC-type cobalt transport system [Salmonella enterica subsp. enterica serovar Give str. S5-487]
MAIVGDNGSGKSTLAQLMAGWYPDYLPGDIDGTGLLLGVPIGRLPLVEQFPIGRLPLVEQRPPGRCWNGYNSGRWNVILSLCFLSVIIFLF